MQRTSISHCNVEPYAAIDNVEDGCSLLVQLEGSGIFGLQQYLLYLLATIFTVSFLVPAMRTGPCMKPN
jgi:hypothetical protein